MNLNDWQQMTPRERDALVAEKVMGWSNVRPFTDGDFGRYHSDDSFSPDDFIADDEARGYIRRVPNYTEDITAAFQVADEIDLFDKYGCAKFLGCDDGAWFVGELRDGEIVYYATAETVPLVICLAGLKAVGAIE